MPRPSPVGIGQQSFGDVRKTAVTQPGNTSKARGAGASVKVHRYFVHFSAINHGVSCLFTTSSGAKSRDFKDVSRIQTCDLTGRFNSPTCKFCYCHRRPLLE